MQEKLLGNNTDFRKQHGTQLKNMKGKIVYTPPQDPTEIINLMSNLEKFINDKNTNNLDDLVKMAIIHHQFETIHPFYDSNGKVRIINFAFNYL